ncbi:hypothetical protein AB0G04_32395 [Actinoplanes sp. NPDC023801]|uniref:hypothetical protein n=1 Tax=Actinoplanes sp. NPDC023801 TaxID=3154595 RepID=UPI0033EAEA85
MLTRIGEGMNNARAAKLEPLPEGYYRIGMVNKVRSRHGGVPVDFYMGYDHLRVTGDEVIIHAFATNVTGGSVTYDCDRVDGPASGRRTGATLTFGKHNPPHSGKLIETRCEDGREGTVSVKPNRKLSMSAVYRNSNEFSSPDGISFVWGPYSEGFRIDLSEQVPTPGPPVF